MARLCPLVLSALLLAWPADQAARAQGLRPPCPIPDNLALHDLNLPRAQAAFAAGGRLVILALGGTATQGKVAGDPGYTYPAQLQAALAAALPRGQFQVLSKPFPSRPDDPLAPHLSTMIAEAGARLVIWATGGQEAARSADIDEYIAKLRRGVVTIQGAGADVILMDPQYAPSIARITNAAPYREALRGTAAAMDVPVLLRYELMMQWNDDGVLHLDAREDAERQRVARHLFACIANALAPAIADALR